VSLPSPSASSSPSSDGFVRAAREGDADDLARVQVASWRSCFAGIVPPALLGELTSSEAAAVWRERWRDAIGNPPTSRHRVLVAVTDGTRDVVGFASAGPATDEDRWPRTDASLYELRVLPEQTRQGHGGRLLHAVASTLADDGFQTVSTWVLSADDAFRGFLESAGWALDGARADLDVGITVPAVRLHTRIGE
jgi:ribosomal protein S18 acetylase RimI-like enzyme